MAAKFVNKEQLLESVRKLPCLYDTSRKEYKDGMLPWQTTNGSIKRTTSSNVKGSIRRPLKHIVLSCNLFLTLMAAKAAGKEL